MIDAQCESKRKDKKTALRPIIMLAERTHKFASFVALLMFLFSSISSAQVMFIDLELDDENQAFANGRSDTDGDGVLDSSDDCLDGITGWTSSALTDHDGDGCKDDTIEDDDDDNDTVDDNDDDCPKGNTGWVSGSTNDNDGDGCRDATEDPDDDNDGLADSSDSCPDGDIGWTSGSATDHDSDGCRDDGVEDNDDDGDTVTDTADDCPRGDTGWTSGPVTDIDGDGCKAVSYTHLTLPTILLV